MNRHSIRFEALWFPSGAPDPEENFEESAGATEVALVWRNLLRCGSA